MTVHGSWTVDRLVDAYTHHQRRTRGLRSGTLRNYALFARKLVRAALGTDPIDPTRLTPAAVVAFITSLSHRRGPTSMSTARSALRSFFRFLRVEGFCGDALEAALPTVAHWRLATLPRSLTEQQAEQVLASFDPSTPCGHRDQAIVQCLATLGLRPGEVANLCLDDIDWRGGTLQIRTRKNRRGAVLPLPRVVGQPLVAYLNGERPATDERRVFVVHQEERRGKPLSSPAVSRVVARAVRRAGVDAPHAGAYVFRHTVASRMVRAGASLKEVADVLGHRSLDTTTIYAKLDLPRLREGGAPMTPPSFHHLVDEYLNARRGLGFGLETQEWFLRDFARHAERIGHSGPMTIELAVQWARSYSRSGNPAQAARRLAIVRQFARYRALIDPATEVPPVGLLGRDSRRRSTPHIYTEAEVAALLQQARRLRPRGGLRPATYVAFFALLASTGLRLSEACRLTTDDADLVDGILTIRETKFRKSRLVPLHPTTTRALRRYANRRDACLAAPRSEYFFRTEQSPRLIHATVESTFRQIRRRLDWTAQGRTSQPRIHSLRHTFVVRRLLRWRQEGADVDRKILALATYLGHAEVAHTYWYCTAVPELLASTGQRFERFAHQASERPS